MSYKKSKIVSSLVSIVFAAGCVAPLTRIDSKINKLTLKHRVETSLTQKISNLPNLIHAVFIQNEVYGLQNISSIDVGYNYARQRILAQITESPRTKPYSEEEIEQYIEFQRYFSDEQIEGWKNSAIAGGTVAGCNDIPEICFDKDGKPREKIIPGRISMGAYEAQIKPAIQIPFAPNGIRIVLF